MSLLRTRLHRGIASFLAAVLVAAISIPMSAMAESENGAPASGNAVTSLPTTVIAPTTTPDASGSSSSAPNSSSTSSSTPQPTQDSPAATPSPSLAVVAQPPTTPTSPSLGASTSAPTQPATDPSSGADTSQPATPQSGTANTTSVTNTVSGSATSGDALISDNKKAGDATSGNATTTATVVNSVSSTSGFGDASGYTYYTHDINAGDSVQGNILIDPSTLSPVTSGSTADGVQTASSLTDIINNITLNATSGSATVADNSKAGNATTGDATAVANIINLVNAQIGAKQTFLGVINIYGNLTGDIDVPSSFVDSLMGMTSNPNGGTTSSLTSSNDTNITNNITANATSGNATVTDNKKAGDATSGNATSSVTVFNLTGQQVIAKNSLLVFVNVLGKWVGVIVNQPTGTTSGALVGGASSQPAGSSLTGSNTTNITNNVTVNAQSGDATVSGNKKAGNATTGDAKSAVNLLNISNSDFSLDGWFGVLFINVLGSWLGNFGIQSALPDPVSSGDSGTGTPPADVIQDVKVFRFDDDAQFTPASTDNGDNGANSASGDIKLAASTQSTTKRDGQNGGHVLGSSDNRGNALVSRIDFVAFLAIVAALTLLLMLGSWAIRKQLAARRPVTL